jgi:hypothetical protein
MVKKILIILFFASMLLSTTAFEAGLKFNPQLIIIVLGLITTVAIWFNIKSVQHFLLNLLVFIGSYTELFMISTGVLDLISPNRDSILVDGERFPVMDFSWVNSMLIAIIGAVVITLVYHFRWKKYGDKFELYYAAGLTVLAGAVCLVF